MAAAPVAAEVPVLAYITVGLLALLAWVCLRGLRTIWTYTFGYIFERLAAVHIPTGVFGNIHPFGFLGDANRALMNTLERTAAKAEHAVGYLFHGAAVIQGWIARELLGLAHDVYGWATWLQHSHLPRWVKALIYAAVPPLVLPLIAHALAGVHPTKLTRITTWKIGVTRAQVKAMIAAALLAATPVTLPLPRLFPRIKRLEGYMPHVWRRLRRLELLLGAAGAAALLARALGLGSVKCVRTGNIGRAARRFCGFDPTLVDTLLNDMLLLTGTLSVGEFIHELQAITPPILEAVDDFVRP